MQYKSPLLYTMILVFLTLAPSETPTAAQPTSTDPSPAVCLVDNFKDVSKWFANNRRAPAQYSSDGDILTLTDPPGGEVTWGTSIYRKFEAVDLEATPFLVVQAIEMTGPFTVTLINDRTGEKRGRVLQLKKPGLAVMNIPDRLGWLEKIPLKVGLYVNDTEKTVKIDWIKFTDNLTEKETAVLKKTAQPNRFHSLTQLAGRQGCRNPKHTRRQRTFLSERTVFKDTATARTIWRMTCDPAVDVNDYYDIPGWNADGSVMGFLSRRTGHKIRWIMDADGSNLRPMPTHSGKSIGSGYWSTIYRDRFYHAEHDNNGTRVLSTNPFTGKTTVIVSNSENLGSMMPPHPSEKWFLLGKRSKTVNDPSRAYVLGLDKSLQKVDFERRFHRLRFTKAPDCRIFFNFDDPRTQWTVLPDGTDRTSIPYSGGHPDWLPNGSELTFYADGGIWAVGYDGRGRRPVCMVGGGHGGSCRDGRWFVSDTNFGGAYPGSILYLKTDGSQTCHTVAKHMSSFYSHSTIWHPDHHSSHPHPNSSPDGTKTLFNSDFLGQYTDIYVAINRLPDPPRGLAVHTREGKHTLTWKRPVRSREIMGYNIYQKQLGTGKDGWLRLTSETVKGEVWNVSGNPPDSRYVVTAVEHSGLEGNPSNPISTVDTPAEKTYLKNEIDRKILDTSPPEKPEKLKAQTLSPNTVHLAWAHDEKDDLDHYNVYSSYGPDVNPEQSSLIGSPAEAEFVDWGLSLNSRPCYRVTAVDRYGNESPPTAAVQIQMPDFQPVRVSLKPENAEVQNMVLTTDPDTGKNILVTGQRNTPDTTSVPQAVSTWQFELPRDANYAIWGRARSTQGKPPRFKLSIDQKTTARWYLFGKWNKWIWSPAGSRRTGTPQLFQLKPGKHLLRLKLEKASPELAEMIITDNPAWYPVTDMSKFGPDG